MTSTRDDRWFDESPRERAGSRPGAHGTTPLRTWLLAVVGAVLIAGAAIAGIAGISAITSSDSVATATGALAPGQLAPAQAAPGSGSAGPGMPGPGPAGTVTEVGTSGFSLETRSGDTVEVTTSGATTFVNASSGSVDDVQEGDRVVAFGERSDSGVAAQRLVTGDEDLLPVGGPGGQGMPDGQGSPGAQGMPAGGPIAGVVAGVIRSIDGSALTISTDGGDTVTLTTSSSTKVEHLQAARASDLEVGDDVMVVGTASDSTVAATRVRIGALDVLPDGAAGPNTGGPNTGGPNGDGPAVPGQPGSDPSDGSGSGATV